MTNNHLYTDAEKRIDTIMGRNQYWLLLRRIKEEWMLKESTHDTELDFGEYLTEYYGIRLQYIDGNISDTPHITDEHLYLLAILKFGK